MDIKGSAAPGFERVAEEFEENFIQRGEVAAQCCVHVDGEQVVDLWASWPLSRASPWTISTTGK